MDLAGHIRSKSLENLARTRGRVAPQSGIATGSIARNAEMAETRRVAFNVEPPKVSAVSGSEVVTGAPAVSGGSYTSVPAQLVKADRVRATPDAETMARGFAARMRVHTTKRPVAYGVANVTPATATLIERFAAEGWSEMEAQEIRNATLLYRKGYRMDKNLRIIQPPNYKSRAMELSKGTLSGFSKSEVSGAEPPEKQVAEIVNREQGYMEGKFSNPIQAAFEQSAANQPKSTISGVLMPVMGSSSAIGFGAQETEAIGAVEEQKIEAAVDPQGIKPETEATKSAMEVGSRAKPPAAEPLPRTGGVMTEVKPSNTPPTYAQEEVRGAVATEATTNPVGQPAGPTDGAGTHVGFSKIKTVPAMPRKPRAKKARVEAPEPEIKPDPPKKRLGFVGSAERVV